MIETASDEELSSLCAIMERVKVVMEEQGIDQWDDLYPTKLDLLSDIREGQLYLMRAPGSDDIAALVAINQQQDPEYSEISWEDDGNPVVVHRLAVDPLHQGKGLATLMMQYVEHHARENNYSSIRLDAFTQNPTACHLYRKIGYSVRGTVEFRKGTFYCYEKLL